jgi:hypothetical protein
MRLLDAAFAVCRLWTSLVAMTQLGKFIQVSARTLRLVQLPEATGAWAWAWATAAAK